MLRDSSYSWLKGMHALFSICEVRRQDRCIQSGAALKSTTSISIVLYVVLFSKQSETIQFCKFFDILDQAIACEICVH